MRSRRLFLCCYAISCVEGSEAGVGFGWLLAARKAWEGEVILLCSTCDPATRHAIRQLDNISIVEFGVVFGGNEKMLRFCEKPIFRFLIHYAYQNWLDQVVNHVGVGFKDDVFHYVNYVGFRFRLNLSQFKGRIVRGPVGGSAYSSWSNILSAPFLTGCYLCLRNVKNWIDVWRVKNTYCTDFDFLIFATNADSAILSSNSETSAVHSEIIFSDVLLPASQATRSCESVQITWIGEYTALKNPHALLRVLSQLVKMGCHNFKCVLFFKSTGEKDIAKLAARFKELANFVELVVDAPRNQVLARLRHSHLYVNLSRKDLTSTALAEALVSQCIPIVANRNGFVDVVDLTNGILLPEENIEGHLLNILIRFMTDARSFEAFPSEPSVCLERFGVLAAVEILREAYGVK